MTAVAPAAPPSDWPRILLGCGIGAVLGLLMLGVALAAWWLAVARHDLQRLAAPEGFETRLEAAAGPVAFGLVPVYVYDPDGAGAAWIAQIAPELEAQNRELLALPIGAEVGREVERLGRRWAEPPRRPLLIWREGPKLILCRCDNPRARALARQALAATARAETPDVLPPPMQTPPRKGRPDGGAYPKLGPPPAPKPVAPSVEAETPARPARPAPRLPGDPAPAARTTTPSARPATSPSAPPSASRRAPQPRRTDAPEARRDADSLFF